MAEDDVLSGEELEALSAEASPGGQGQSEGQPVDLASLERRVPLPLPGLEAVLEQFGADIGKRLGALLGEPVDAQPQGLRAGSGDAYANALEIPSHVTPLDVTGELNGQVLLVLSAGVVDQLVSRRFGGGASGRGATAQRETLSTAEERLGQELVGYLAPDLAQAWRPLAAVDVHPGEAGDGRLVGSLAGSSESLVSASFELALGESQARAELAIPYRMLQPLEATLRAGLPNRPQESGPGQAELLEHGAAGVELELAARLTAQKLTLAEVSALQPGDVLRIDPPEEAKLVADGVTLAEGAFGVVDDVNGLRVDRTYLQQRQRDQR